MIFETHAHYDDEAYDDDRDALLSSMQENGIGWIVNVGASLKSTLVSNLQKNILLSMRRRVCTRARQRN